jgi:hypothetical protein
MKNQTISPIVLDIVNDVRKIRLLNCDAYDSQNHEHVHRDWTDAMRAITVEEDIKDVTEIIEWSKNTGRTIQSPEDYHAYVLWETYYDLHKDAYGVKAHHTKWFDHDAKGWQDSINALPSS